MAELVPVPAAGMLVVIGDPLASVRCATVVLVVEPFRPVTVTWMVPLVSGTTAAVTVLWPVMASAVAVMVAEPAARADTRPEPLTASAVALLLAQVMVRPVRMLPTLSLSVAVKAAVWPTLMVVEAGV